MPTAQIAVRLQPRASRDKVVGVEGLDATALAALFSD
jgi:uncharacterized protein YggU (UPF0235/DUF167 family)